MDCNNSDRLVVLEHRHGDDSADAAKLDRIDHSGMTLAYASVAARSAICTALGSHGDFKRSAWRGLEVANP